MEVVAVIDFETTGLSPVQGGRATEVAAVILEDGKVDVAGFKSGSRMAFAESHDSPVCRATTEIGMCRAMPAISRA